MVDGTFAGTAVYLCEHTEQGALGLVINKPICIRLKDLFSRVELPLESPELAAQPVYFGGPVQTERGFVLHEKIGGVDSPYSSTLSIPGGLEMTTSRDVLEAMSHGAGPKRVLVTLGYERLGRRTARGRDRPQRLAQRRRQARDHLRHPGGRALRARAVAARLRPADAQPGGGARMNAGGDLLARPRSYLAFDFGTVRIGVASGNSCSATGSRWRPCRAAAAGASSGSPG